MQADVHDAAGPGAFRVQHLQLLDQDVAHLIGGMPATHDQGEIIDLVRIRHGDDRPVGRAQQVGLVVVHQVAIKTAAVLGQDVSRLQRAPQG